MTSIECENILNKYIELINKDYCSDCNELNCIDNFPHNKIAEALKHLMLENQIQQDTIKTQKLVIDNLSERITNATERLEALIIFWKKYNPADNHMQVEQFKGVKGILEGDNK